MMVNISKLTNEEIRFIQILLDYYPHKIHKIYEEINLLIINDIFNIHDVPQIVIILSNMYHSHLLEIVISSDEKENISIINIIKFTTDSILDAKLLPFPTIIETKIIKQLVNTSLTLLNMKLPIIKKQEEEKEEICCSFFSIYKKKK